MANNYLAGMLPRFHVFMRLLDILQRKSRIDMDK
jgi:hypothetical protein